MGPDFLDRQYDTKKGSLARLLNAYDVTKGVTNFAYVASCI